MKKITESQVKKAVNEFIEMYSKVPQNIDPEDVEFYNKMYTEIKEELIEYHRIEKQENGNYYLYVDALFYDIVRGNAGDVAEEKFYSVMKNNNIGIDFYDASILLLYRD